jgi:hypothetical protein
MLKSILRSVGESKMRGFAVALMVGLLAFSAPAMAQAPQPGDSCQTPEGQPGRLVDENGTLTCRVECQTAEGQQGRLVDENGTLACRVGGFFNIAIAGVGAAGVLLGVVLLGGGSGNGPASP